MSKQRNLITTTEAAAILGVSSRAVRFHIAAGHLNGIAVNDRLTLLDRSEVEQFTPAKVGRPKAAPQKLSVRRGKKTA